MFILNLHGIGRPRRQLAASEQRVWIDEPFFHAILDFAGTRNDVELTFDDANESDFTIALPALQARALKARFFIVAGRVGQPAFLSRSQLQALLAAGMEIGSHGMRHRPWAGLDKKELREELVEAKELLEQWTGVQVDKASCPFGSYNRRVVGELLGAGYKNMYTSDGGPVANGSFILPRISVYRTVCLESIKAMVHEQPNCAHRIWRGAKLLAKRWR
jgi:peptidoglycan/xylan/chitin deacetylase (PgdA/CDA1 family)